MGKNWKEFAEKNPNWPVLLVLLIPLCYLGWYLSLSFGNPKHARNVTWSPSGDKIAFECIYLTSSDYIDGMKNDGIFLFPMRDICIKDISSGDTARVTDDRGKYSPAWSSDGKSLAWISTLEIGYKYELVVWNLSEDSYKNYLLPKALPFVEYYEDKLEWINKDRQLAIQGIGVILDLESGDFTYLSRNIGGFPVRYNSISPDGGFVAVVLNMEDEDGNLQFLIIEDNKVKLIAQDDSIHFDPPEWSKNSKYVIWVSTSDNEYNQSEDTILVTNIHSGVTLDLGMQSVIDIDFPVWSKNGNQIIFMSFFDELHVLDINISDDPFDVDINQHNVIDISRRDLSYPFSVSSNGHFVTFASGENQKLVVESIID